MKTLKTNLVAAIVAFGLCVSMLTFSTCSSDDDADPCEAFECLNGGEKIAGTDGCQCDCPPNYSGENCEIPFPKCPVTVECPIGQSPNPDNDCACE